MGRKVWGVPGVLTIAPSLTPAQPWLNRSEPCSLRRLFASAVGAGNMAMERCDSRPAGEAGQAGPDALGHPVRTRSPYPDRVATGTDASVGRATRLLGLALLPVVLPLEITRRLRVGFSFVFGHGGGALKRLRNGLGRA